MGEKNSLSRGACFVSCFCQISKMTKLLQQKLLVLIWIVIAGCPISHRVKNENSPVHLFCQQQQLESRSKHVKARWTYVIDRLYYIIVAYN